MHSVHKWLLTSSVTPIRPRISLRTLICLVEPSRPLMNLQSILCDLKNLVVPSGAQWCPVVPSGAQWCPVVLTGREGEPRPLKAAPFPNLNGLDNTVGPVPKISGYVFNTLQTNSAAHVPNTDMNLINEDTHNCDLNLYETILVVTGTDLYHIENVSINLTSDIIYIYINAISAAI